jgi:hypothetical protein
MSLARNIITIINNENRFTINEGMKTAINGEKTEVSRKGMNVFKKAETTGKSLGMTTYIGVIKNKNNIHTDEPIEDRFLVVYCKKNDDGKYYCGYKNPKEYDNYIEDKYGSGRREPSSDPKLVLRKLAGSSGITVFLDKYDVELPEAERNEIAYSRIIHVTGEKVLEKVM